MAAFLRKVLGRLGMPVSWASSPVCDEGAAVLAAVQDAARRASAVACGHPGPPLRATAWASAGRDDRMAVLIEQQDGCWCFACRRPAGRGLRLWWAGSQRLGHGLGFAALACTLLGAFAGLLEPVGLAFDGDDLGVVDEVVDQRNDAGDVAKHLKLPQWRTG